MADKEKDGYDASAFEALEADFNETLTQLAQDSSLQKFKVEYEKLYDHFKKSHTQEKRLIHKVRELNDEIMNNAKKVQTALKLSEEDQAQITRLKEEVDRAWKMVDASKEKELRAKETIQELRKEIDNLTTLVDKGAGLSLDHENAINAITKHRDEIAHTLEEQKKENKGHQETIDDLSEEVERERTAKLALEEEHGSALQMIRDKEKAEVREQRRKERMDMELRNIREKLEHKNQNVERLDGLHQEAVHKSKNLAIQLKEARGTMDKYLRDYKHLFEKCEEVKKREEEQIQKTLLLKQDITRLEAIIVDRDREVNRTREDAARLRRQWDTEKKKVGRLENKRLEEKHEKDLVVQTSNQQAQEILRHTKTNNMATRKINTMARNADMQAKQIIRHQQLTKEEEAKVSLQVRNVNRLKGELITFEQEAQQQRKLIYKLEKARERMGMEATEAHNKYLSQLEETKLKERTIAELQREVLELQQKLKSQQQLYEAVRSDRNLYSKNLIESQDEIAEMKRKFKIMNHQMEQLKEEITAKDHALVKEHFEHQKVEKQREQLKNELGKVKKLKAKAEATIEKQHAEIGKLTHIIARLEEDAIQQHKEYDQVINERDILGTQLIRRNDELALLYEKIKIQQSTLHKGEAQYKDRLQELRLMKLNLRDLMRKLRLTSNSSDQVPELKRECFSLQRELLHERTKVKALSEELENPMNVHRWRQLEGSDPTTHEMIQKIHTLQKRLIAKTEEVVEKDLLITEKEKLYVELKNILARQPGPEVAEQLTIYQQNLKEKTRQMKAMASELNMYQAQANEFKYEIERLLQELNDVKRKYYEQKKMQMMARESKRGGVSAGERQAREQRLQSQAALPKYTGGGFNVTQ